MTRRDPTVALRYMLDHAREAVAFAQGRTRADLDTNRLLNLALVRLMHVVGEAARRVPAETQAPLPGIAWPQVIGLRNRLVHGYDTINFATPWDIVTHELPPLIAELERALEAEGGRVNDEDAT